MLITTSNLSSRVKWLPSIIFNVKVVNSTKKFIQYLKRNSTEVMSYGV